MFFRHVLARIREIGALDGLGIFSSPATCSGCGHAKENPAPLTVNGSLVDDVGRDVVLDGVVEALEPERGAVAPVVVGQPRRGSLGLPRPTMPTTKLWMNSL